MKKDWHTPEISCISIDNTELSTRGDNPDGGHIEVMPGILIDETSL